jgi:ubiquinone/menaquinone biosynthesis C-methylase UbiE
MRADRPRDSNSLGGSTATPEHDRHGAKQPYRFDPARAGALDDRARFEYLPPAELFALLGAPKGSTVVDFGTGTGTYAIELARERPDLRVVALDEQQAMLDKLLAKLAPAPVKNLHVVMARTPAARALEGKVERVLAINVLHELGDEALEELLALPGRGGRILLVDWNAAAEREVGPPRDHVYAPKEAADRLVGTGFKVEGEKLFRYHYALWGR